jgi:hypothetical protein
MIPGEAEAPRGGKFPGGRDHVPVSGPPDAPLRLK